MIKISIIVPVYNVEKYIDKCLNSLVNQTLPEIEVIVINDGSKDNSQQIIDKYVKLYPSKVYSFTKRNGGLSDARNFGMNFCKGEYVGFIDSDDYVDSEMYESMYNEAKINNADIVQCDYLLEYAKKRRVVKANFYKSKKEVLIYGLAAAWNKIYRRNLLKRNNILFPKGLIYEDTEFFCKLIPYVDKFGYVNRAFVHYVQRCGSIANTQGTKIANIFQVFDNVLAFYKKQNFFNEYNQELLYFIVKVLLGSSMERICRCSSRKIRKQLLNETMFFLDVTLKGWRKNPYLKRNTVKNIYMRNVNAVTVSFFAGILRFYFKSIDKNLQ